MPRKIELTENMQYPGIEMTRTGRWLRSICKVKKVSVIMLRQYLRLGSSQSVYGWFCGRTLPSLDNFYAVSQLLCVPLDELIINREEVLPVRFCRRVGKANARLANYWLKMAL